MKTLAGPIMGVLGDEVVAHGQGGARGMLWREGGANIVEIGTLWLITAVHIIVSKLLSLALLPHYLDMWCHILPFYNFIECSPEAETYRI